MLTGTCLRRLIGTILYQRLLIGMDPARITLIGII